MHRIFYILIFGMGFIVLTIAVFMTSEFYANKWNAERLRQIRLIDSRGNPWNLSKLNDKLGIIYFGYTFCPDLCPSALNDLSIALEGMGHDRDLYQPLFISVDPERDTQRVIQDYIQHFSKNLIGLSGSTAKLKSFTFNIGATYAQQRKTPGDQNYLVNHTVGYFMVNSEGQRFPIPIKDNPEQLRKIIIQLKEKMSKK